MLTSAEVRWFFEGAIPDEIEQWFCRGDLLYKAAPREDHYLALPASLALNIKLREGRLEIKPLANTLGVRNFTVDVAGHVQLWEKWSGGDAAVKEFERLRTSNPGLWITVTKERRLRKFSLNGDSIKEVDAGKVFLSQGCNVELTKVTVDGLWYWSFAFEAFGDPSHVAEYLPRVAERVLSDNRHPHYPFSVNNSHSYPEWLARLSKTA